MTFANPRQNARQSLVDIKGLGKRTPNIPSHIRSAWRMSTFQTSKRDARSAVLLLKAPSSAFFAEKKAPLAFCARLPCPDQPPSVALSVVQCACTLLSTFRARQSTLDWDSAWHNTTQKHHPNLIHQRRSPICVWEYWLCLRTIFAFLFFWTKSENPSSSDYHCVFVFPAEFW